MTADTRILIVGGYGVFGARLVELLEDDARLTLIVAGRSLARARDFCASRKNASAKVIFAVFDRAVDLKQLSELRPTIVVDASGPFQEYGERPYRLIEQCIACKVSYLDLADGSNFVAGVTVFDEAAKAAGVYVLSGVSSFPVLTAAVVRELSIAMKKIISIRGGIAPSPYAGVGLNVIRAISNYSGKKIQVKRAGKVTSGYPFAESMEFVIAVPGRIPLKRRRFSLVDVPDLQALRTLWPDVSDVWMGAAPAPPALHRMLTVFAWLVRIRLLPSLAWMAPMMHFVTNHVRWGEHRGGMFVKVHGEDTNDQPTVREWHLLAEGDDGPLIPCMAIEAIIRKSLAGGVPQSGARTAFEDVQLNDYEQLFTRRTIYSGVRDRKDVDRLPRYRSVLGTAWEQLAAEIKQLHSIDDESVFAGTCNVQRGRNVLAWLVGAAIGFPKAGHERNIVVKLTRYRKGERWLRSCSGASFSSVQYAGSKGSEWLICERFGPVSVGMALVVKDECLHYVIRRWSFLGIPLPLVLGPRSTAIESVQHGKFHFDVEISHAFVGLIVRYNGLLSRMRGSTKN